MKRAGFTMIELIFVIVILGILAAVAVPKMGETSTSAKVQNIESFVGTLNRTVGASMWAKALRQTTMPGSVKQAAPNDFDLSDYIDLPNEIQAVTGQTVATLLTQCGDANTSTYAPVMQIKAGTFPNVTFKDANGSNIDTTGTPGSLNIYCKDGSSVEQPMFAFSTTGTTKLTYTLP
jgi:prepilin-type N-terminal cleavage/methylation domain-containing protein